MKENTVKCSEKEIFKMNFFNERKKQNYNIKLNI